MNKKEEIKKYAVLIQSMTLDFQMGTITYEHYVNTLSIISTRMVEIVNA
jgi:hypothetical protein